MIVYMPNFPELLVETQIERSVQVEILWKQWLVSRRNWTYFDLSNQKQKFLFAVRPALLAGSNQNGGYSHEVF